MSDGQRKELNLKACRLIQSKGIQILVEGNIYDVIREKCGFIGFANYYLMGCYDKSERKNKADITIYKQLLEIDSKLGTTQTEQLFKCVFHSVRIDLIKV